MMVCCSGSGVRVAIGKCRLPRASRLFLRFFLPYFAVLGIPFVIGAAFYLSTVRVIEGHAKSSALAILEQTRDIVDTRFEELDSTAKQLSLSASVLSFLTMGSIPEGSAGFYELWSYWSTLPNYSLANSFISSFFIIPRNGDFIISAEELLRSDPEQYERVFKYKDWSYGDWRNYLFSERRFGQVLSQATLKLGGSRKASGVFYLQSLPVDHSKNALGVFLVFIDEASIKSLLRRLDAGDRGLVFIADASGELIAGLAGKDCTIDLGEAAGKGAKNLLGDYEAKGYIVSRTTSGQSGWSYASVLPSDLVLSDVGRIRDIALITLGLGLLAGVVAAILLARRSSAPIRQIAHRVTRLVAMAEMPGCRDELEYLGAAFEGLAGKDARLRAELERQVPVIRSDVARRLLHGLYGNDEEAHSLALVAGIDLRGRPLTAAAVRITGYRGPLNVELLEELKVARAALAEALLADSREGVLIAEEDYSLVGIIFSWDSTDRGGAEREAEARLRSLAESLSRSYQVRIEWAIDATVASVSELPSAYMRARRHIGNDELQLGEGGSGGGNGEAVFFFPIETELRLVAALRGGDKETLRSLLAELAKENLETRSLGDQRFHDFTEAIKVTVLRGFGEQRMLGAAGAIVPRFAEDLDRLDPSDRRAWFSQAEALLLGLVDSLLSLRGMARRELAEAVASRLAQVYTDPALTIYSVAQEFGLSESSFYHFFRSAFGESFADYVEGLRVREACARLGRPSPSASGAVAIKDVAAAVGFASSTTFRRAFHRVVGLSPSEYLRVEGKA